MNYFNYNSNLDLTKISLPYGNTVNSSCHNLNKLRGIKNNNKRSFKFLIQDEKIKNILKPKKSKIISKEKANKIIDNLLNNNKKIKK